MQSGLRSRLRRALQRVEGQHRKIRQIRDQLEAAVIAGADSRVEASVGLLRDALRAHFDLEEQVLFPALHGLVPATRQEIAQLERDHGAFLSSLQGLLPQEGGKPAGVNDLEALGERLDAHERIEERLMTQVLSETEDLDDDPSVSPPRR